MPARDEANPFDSNAVKVLLDGSIVGYLPREVAADWSAFVLRVERRGLDARATLRVLHYQPLGEPHPRFYLGLHVPASPSELVAPEVYPGRCNLHDRPARHVRSARHRRRRMTMLTRASD